MVHLEPPDSEWVKCNTDRACRAYNKGPVKRGMPNRFSINRENSPQERYTSSFRRSTMVHPNKSSPRTRNTSIGFTSTQKVKLEINQKVDTRRQGGVPWRADITLPFQGWRTLITQRRRKSKESEKGDGK
ncbi:hypothetical protein H5410_057592 [Solanum commersonii]|uniref:Uncharacterized protein n=1 Tax=Solanum commersonii TaxID=4109 RepID=A0A9J5WPF6_SOLCO|nr:hypothetical protein H5410_057592 [Solanum commersonii]